MNSVIQLLDITRTYRQGPEAVHVLENFSLTLEPGEIAALVGPSGSGKTTLLQIAGLLDPPDKGTVLIKGTACTTMQDADRTRIRRDQIGFVYQFHHLLPELSAEENVMMPQLIAGKSKSAAKDRAHELLGMVKLDHRLSHRPFELSGGEQQRVAIARALANSPALILADEPTGNLDPETADHVFSILVETLKKNNAAALIATHNLELAKRMDKKIALK
ncbi:MAG: ABC transporter ATP-binding protein [Rickettsiales bacterium]